MAKHKAEKEKEKETRKTAARKSAGSPPRKSAAIQLTFRSTLESISDELEYYAIPVPPATTRKLGTRAAVPVLAQINGFTPFQVSLHPRGDGTHAMRVRAKVRKEAGVKECDRLTVKVTVIDRAQAVAVSALPKDVESALRKERALDGFQAIPKGQAAFALRRIDDAAKPETRAKRIQELVEEAHRRAEK